MASEDQITKTPTPGSWNVPQILHTLVSPLTYLGLVVICLTAMVGMSLQATLDSPDQLVLVVFGLTCLLACFFGVAKYTKSPKDLVVEVSYLKQLAETRQLVTGNALTDVIDDRIERWISEHYTGDQEMREALGKRAGAVPVAGRGASATKSGEASGSNRLKRFENQTAASE